MSKKGCPPDNSACEGLFGRLNSDDFARLASRLFIAVIVIIFMAMLYSEQGEEFLPVFRVSIVTAPIKASHSS